MSSIANPEGVSSVQENCSICLDDLTEMQGKSETTNKVIDCGHRFHMACIDRWLTERSVSGSQDAKCPLCNRVIIPQNKPQLSLSVTSILGPALAPDAHSPLNISFVPRYDRSNLLASDTLNTDILLGQLRLQYRFIYMDLISVQNVMRDAHRVTSFVNATLIQANRERAMSRFANSLNSISIYDVEGNANI